MPARVSVTAAIAMASLAGAVWAATPPDPPPPADLTPASIDRWEQAIGLKRNRYAQLKVTPEGVYYASTQMSLGPATSDPREGRSSQFTVVFERFKPVVNARGKEVRSERADLELKCTNTATVRIQGAVQAYVGHGLSGGSAGPGDPALWTEFAPNGRQPATPKAAVLPLLFGC